MYVNNNITLFYEFCYIENNTYYIVIEDGKIIHKYILDEYIEKIKINKFFSGFIEIYTTAIILNRPIVILDNLDFLNKYFIII